MKRILVIASQCVNKQSEHFACSPRTLSQPEFSSQGSINMVEMLQSRLKQYFDPLITCYLSKGSLKRDFLDIYLTTSFGVSKLKNTLAMRVIFFSICSKLNLNLLNGKCKKIKNKIKKMEKIFFVFGIIASENVAINCLCLEENTCHGQSMS